MKLPMYLRFCWRVLGPAVADYLVRAGLKHAQTDPDCQAYLTRAGTPSARAFAEGYARLVLRASARHLETEQ